MTATLASVHRHLVLFDPLKRAVFRDSLLIVGWKSFVFPIFYHFPPVPVDSPWAASFQRDGLIGCEYWFLSPKRFDYWIDSTKPTHSFIVAVGWWWTITRNCSDAVAHCGGVAVGWWWTITRNCSDAVAHCGAWLSCGLSGIGFRTASPANEDQWGATSICHARSRPACARRLVQGHISERERSELNRFSSVEPLVSPETSFRFSGAAAANWSRNGSEANKRAVISQWNVNSSSSTT